MRINGFLGVSLIDYPGNITSIVYTSPCNFRCPFCHNPSLIDRNGETLNGVELMNEISDRAGFVDAVTITGGEPTLHPGLGDFCAQVKKFGLKVKLDTNGYRPDVIEDLIKTGRVDHIAMDIKAAPLKYEKAAGVKIDIEKIMQSIGVIIKSGVAHEFRTTVVPGITEPADFAEIGKMINGALMFAVQQFVPENTLEAAFRGIKPFPESVLEEIKEEMGKYAGKVRVLNLASFV
jgi:pyruvate formate lyase activating enzyme